MVWEAKFFFSDIWTFTYNAPTADVGLVGGDLTEAFGVFHAGSTAVLRMTHTAHTLGPLKPLSLLYTRLRNIYWIGTDR